MLFEVLKEADFVIEIVRQCKGRQDLKINIAFISPTSSEIQVCIHLYTCMLKCLISTSVETVVLMIQQRSASISMSCVTRCCLGRVWESNRQQVYIADCEGINASSQWRVTSLSKTGAVAGPSQLWIQ